MGCIALPYSASPQPVHLSVTMPTRPVTVSAPLRRSRTAEIPFRERSFVQVRCDEGSTAPPPDQQLLPPLQVNGRDGTSSSVQAGEALCVLQRSPRVGSLISVVSGRISAAPRRAHDDEASNLFNQCRERLSPLCRQSGEKGTHES